jgi:hypothetical protein
MKRKLMARQRRNVLIAACGLLLGTWTMQGCKDDTLLEGQPSWLGNSIYERLQEDGNFTTLLRLVDDLGQHEVLSHTGSKTLFAANDSAFQEWFKQNSWGVSSYGQLSNSQKKLLLNNSMINNAYLIELLSNVSGNPPMEGKCMRRETAVSIYDSVEILSPDKMPNTASWKRFKDSGKSIPIFKDATAAPMIHFLPAFSSFNKLTDEDLAILTNHQANNVKEAWVNGKKVVERDITCKNGYIQKVNGVIESSPNMAEIIRQHPNMSLWSHLLDRYSAPYYDAAGTREYNRLYNNEDSVFTLRYFSDRSVNGDKNEVDPNGNTVKALLKFDPGWNHYMYANTMQYDLHYDAGVMIVPTNEALEYWWDHGGKDLQTEYGTWDSIPDATLSKLIRVNMLPTFTEAFPSKFNQVLNDAKEELGITPADVDSCFMGCNGVVYMTNKVFTPAEYASVAYPALAHASTMNVIYWAIDQLNFLPYLLSMDSHYSLLLPTNDAMLWYIDPATYGTIDRLTGLESPSILEFYYDGTKSAAERVQARRYQCTIDAEGNITRGARVQAQVDRKVVNDRLSRLMDQLIIVGDVRDGHEYYKSKGGTLLRVTKAADGRLAFIGGWQSEHGNLQLPVNNNEIYLKENGESYQLNGQKLVDGEGQTYKPYMPLGAQNTVYLTLQQHEEFSEFLNLLDHDGADLLGTKLSNKYNAGLTNQGSKNLRLLDNYNYTIYVPTNESIRQLINDGLLPTWEDYEAQTDDVWGSEALADSVRNVLKDIIVSFIRYHVQDHSVAVNMAPEDGSYVNAYESMRRNLETGRFYPIDVNFAGGEITLKDVVGQTRHVVKQDGLYNLICREYWFDGSGNNQTTFMASDAVVHLIDGPLLFENLTPWRTLISKIRRK